MAVKDTKLATAMTGGMALVEDRLLASVATDNDLLATTSRHLIVAGGQRLRPFLVLLAAQLGTGTSNDVVKAAVVVELTHLATLCHDDIMDGALLRRGVPSTHANWGVRTAVRTGDFLLARASMLVSELGDVATRYQSRTFNQLVEGQTSETTGPLSGADALDHHLQVLHGKTASLFALSGRLGGLTSCVSADVAHSVERACEAWGLAYQLSDDVLDVTSDPAVSGKAPGADLRAAVRTLPTLYALQSVQASDARLLDLLQMGPLTDEQLHAEALQLLRAHPSVDLARVQVRHWADKAELELRALPASPPRAAFIALCDLVRVQILT